MKLIVLAALMCFSLCAGAQIQWAIKAGVQLDGARYIRNGSKVSTNNIAGLNAGILARIYFDDKVAFVTGLQYNARGFAVKTLPNDTLKTYRLNYADIPVMLHFDLSEKRGEGWYCKAGPSVGIGLYGREMYTGMNGQKIRNKAILSMTGNYFGLFDAALNGAIGYSVNRHFFIEAAYAYGIGNINNDPDGPNIKTRTLALNVGWFLR